MLTFRSLLGARLRAAMVGAVVTGALSGCSLPFGLGLPTTRALESGAAATLTSASSFELTGSYSEGSDRWTIDLQIERGGAEHAWVTASNLQLEAIIVGNQAYFRGQQYLSAHMGSDVVSRSFVRTAGNGWWKAAAGEVPKLPDLTDGKRLRSTFLGQASTQRIDHVSVDGVSAVEFSGPRAEVFLAAQAPYRVLRVRLKHGVVVDGIRDGDLRYGNYNRDFRISAPTDVIDFSDLSPLPPIYTVVSVDTSQCSSPCTVSAQLKNLGGMLGAPAPSTATFTMTDMASKQVLATCQAVVQPDVGFNSTTTVGCTMPDLVPQHGNALNVAAVADNPGGR